MVSQPGESGRTEFLNLRVSSRVGNENQEGLPSTRYFAGQVWEKEPRGLKMQLGVGVIRPWRRGDNMLCPNDSYLTSMHNDLNTKGSWSYKIRAQLNIDTCQLGISEKELCPSGRMTIWITIQEFTFRIPSKCSGFSIAEQDLVFTVHHRSTNECGLLWAFPTSIKISISLKHTSLMSH